MFDEEGIITVFSDIQDLSAECRFRDCTHTAEPGCAVREAVDEGDMSDDRLEHYQKLGAEARAYEVRHDERRKRQEDKAFGKMVSRDGALLRRWKQGK